MKLIALLPALLVAAYLVRPSTVNPTDPRVVAIKLSDLPKGYLLSRAFYCPSSQIVKPVKRHGLVNCYDEAFGPKNSSQTSGMLALDADAASFKTAAGARWSLTYLAGYVKSHLPKTYHLKHLSAPKFGNQSVAFQIRGASSGYKISGPLIAMRVGRYDEVMFALGVTGKFDNSTAYPIARAGAARLATGN